ncbi:hypothetical protein D7X87_26540, partial [bacterium D16-54]
EQYYLRARYYNPVIGRFMQEDTYRGDGLNLYAYCKSPIAGGDLKSGMPNAPAGLLWDGGASAGRAHAGLL